MDETIPKAAIGRKLSIAHLLLWMAGTAFALAFFRTFFDTDQAARLQLAARIFGLLLAPLYGAALASMPLAALHAAYGKRGFPDQPGHWLLIVQGASFLAGAVVTLATQPAEPILGYSELSLLAATREFWRLVPSLIVTLFVLSRVNEPRWRWMFGLMAAGYCTLVLFGCRALGATMDMYHLGTSFLWLFQTLSAVVLVGCVVIDRNMSIQRDFLHWVGVVVRIAGVGAGWLLPWAYVLVRDNYN